MIIKSYEIKKNKLNILENNLFLLYGENFGLKKDIKNYKHFDLDIRNYKSLEKIFKKYSKFLKN